MEKPKPMTEEEIKEAEAQMNPQVEWEENEKPRRRPKEN